MAYRRRRYFRKRKLTTAKIYGNRSARAQSYQIAKINRRVNYLTKLNRPEVLTLWRSFDRTFTNSALASNYEVGWYTHPWGASSGKSFNDDLQGNFCRAMGFNFKAIVEYSDSWSGNVTQTENHQRSASYRIVILQYKKECRGDAEGTIFDSIFNVGSTTTSDDVNTTKPLKSGITAVYKVLYTKTYTISNENPIRQLDINISSRKLSNFNRVLNSSGGNQLEYFPAGTILVAVLTGGLHFDTDYNSQIKIASTCKISFTDN